MSAISIASNLSLNTKKVEQQLKALANVIPPVSAPVSIDTKEIDKEIKRLNQVNFDWELLSKSQIKTFQDQVKGIQDKAQFKIAPDVGFAEIDTLTKKLDRLQDLSDFTIAPQADFRGIEKLKSEFKKLERGNYFDSEIKVTSNSNSGGGFKDLGSVFEAQKDLLGAIADEQRNTQQAIREESSVSVGNLLKSQIAEAGIGGIKRAVVEEFNIDTQGFEKFIKKVLPSRQIIASDLQKFSQNLSDATGASDLWSNTVNDLLVAIADATAGTNNFQEISENLKTELGAVIKSFKEDLAEVRSETDSLEKIQSILGLQSKDQAIKTLADTNTVKSTVRSIVNATQKQVAERKDRIQDDRLVDVLERAQQILEAPAKAVKVKSAEEINQLDPKKREDAIIRNAKRVATRYENTLEVIDDSLEELLIVIGGHTQTANNGVLAAKDLNQAFQELGTFNKRKAVGIKNPDTFTGTGENPASAAFSVARPNVRGFSRDSEELASQAIAALLKSPNLKVKLIGESGGGLRVEEAIQILNKLGYGDRVSGQGLGTPSFKAKASRSQNFTAQLGINSQEPVGNFAKNTLEGLGVLDADFTKKDPKVSQSLKAIADHSLDAYLDHFETQAFIFGDKLAKELGGKQQVRASTESILALRKRVLENISLGFVDYARKELAQFEDTTRITGNAKPLFDKLKQDFEEVEIFAYDEYLDRILAISKNIKTINKALPKAEKDGAVDFFQEVRGKIPQLEVELKQLGLSSPKLAKTIVDEAVKDLKTLNNNLPTIKDPELLKANAFKKELDNTLNTLAGIEPTKAIAAITEIEPELKKYLAVVRNLDNNSSDKQRIQGALESQLKAIKTAKKLTLLAVEFDFKELVKNPSEYLPLLKDASLAKSKESVKQSSLRFATTVKKKAESAIEDFAEGFKDQLLNVIEGIKKKALPGNNDTPLLGAGGGLVKADQGGLVKSKAVEAIQAVVLRGMTDVVSTSRNTYEAVQGLEQFLFTFVPALKPTKGFLQASAPVIGGLALASQSPELAQLAKFTSAELAQVIEPLIAVLRETTANGLGNAVGQIPGIGFGARGAIQLLINNNALNPQIAQALAGIGTFGALGGGTSAIAKAGGRLVARKTFEKLPESIQNTLTPENIQAFDQLVGQRQKEIKALGSQLNKQIAQIKGSDGDVQVSSQKLLASYQGLGTEIAELEQAVSANNKIASDRTRSRIKELKGIQKSIGKAITRIGDKSLDVATNTIENIFKVKIEPLNQDNVTKKTLKKAIKDYKEEIIAVRKKIEKQILSGKVTNADLKGAEQLAKQGQALSNSLKAQGGFSGDARALSGVSNTLAKKVAGLRNEAEKVSDEVVNGIIQGSNKKLALVFIQGRILGKELLGGFKRELDIRSPSGEFERAIADVTKGSGKGVDKQKSEFAKQGKELGQNLSEGFRTATDTKLRTNLLNANKSVSKIEKRLALFTRRSAKLLENSKTASIVDLAAIEKEFNDLKKLTTQAAKNLEVAKKRQKAALFEFRKGAQIPPRPAKPNNAIASEPVKTAQNNFVASLKQELNNVFKSEKDKAIEVGKAINSQVTKELQTRGADKATVSNRIADNQTKIKKARQLQAQIEKRAKKANVEERASIRAKARSLEKYISKAKEELVVLAQRQKLIRQNAQATKKLDNLNEQLDGAVKDGDRAKIRQLTKEIEKLLRLFNVKPKARLKQGITEINDKLDKVRRTAKNVLKAVIGFASIRLSSNIGFFLENTARQALETTIEMERLKTSIDFTGGDGAFEKVTDRAIRLKTDIRSVASAYKGLAASARGTELEAETDAIFNAALNASKTFQLSGEQTEGALLAISQIISKGKVQAEELRGQLGERIPGAFQIAARSMGITTAELDKLLSTGQVLATDFLPGFAKQLSKETSDGVTGALNTTGSSLQNLRNEYTLFQLEVGKATESATGTFFNTVAAGIAIASDNLEVIIPITKVLAATTITLLLPAIASLIGLVKSAVVAYLPKLLTLLGANSKGMTALGKSAKVASAALKTLLVLEGISQAIGLFIKLRNTNKEAGDAIDDLAVSYADFLEGLSKIRPGDQQIKLFDEDIVDLNREKLKKELSGTQKFIDGLLSPILGGTSFNENFGLRDASSKLNEAIKQVEENTKKLEIEIGTDVKEIETKELDLAVTNVEKNIKNLNAQTPVTIGDLEAQREAIASLEERLKSYNEELVRRNGLTKSVAQIALEEQERTREADTAKAKAIAQLNRDLLESGDVQKDISKQVLLENEKAIEIELSSKKKAIAEIESLEEKSQKQNEKKLKDYQDRVVELEGELVSTKVELAQKELDKRVNQYEEFLEEIESRRQESENFGLAAEKERSLEIQQLLNDGVIAQEAAETLKASNSSIRIAEELENEKFKLTELKRFNSQSVEDEKRNQDEIFQSRQKVYDLTINLLEQQRQAEEKAIDAIAQKREANFERLKSIQERTDQLSQDRGSLQERSADLEIQTLQRGLAIRRQLDSDDLNPNERRDLLRELNGLNIKGRTSELSLLKKIDDRQAKLAALKLENLNRQQAVEERLLAIENEKLVIATKKAAIDAKKSLNNADEELVEAEFNLENAESPEEVERAGKLFDLAKEKVLLAEAEVEIVDKELAQLDSVIDKKLDNLAISQAIARTELENQNKLRKGEADRERTQAKENRTVRRGGQAPLSTAERIENRINAVREKVGDEFTEEQEKELRDKFSRQERSRDSRRLRSQRFISVPNTGRSITVPTLQTNRQVSERSVQAKEGGNMEILKTLKEIKASFKQPKVVNVTNNNEIVNKIDKGDSDDIVRQARVQTLEAINQWQPSF